MLAAFVVAWTSVMKEFSLSNGDSCRMGDNRVKQVLMVLVSSLEDSFSLCPRNRGTFRKCSGTFRPKRSSRSENSPIRLHFSLLQFSALEINQKDIDWNLKILFHHPVSLYITPSSSAVKTSMGPGDNASEGH